MSDPCPQPRLVERLIDELAPFLAQHGLRARWHPSSKLLRLDDAAGDVAPVAVTLEDNFVAKFERASADVQSRTLLSIFTMVDMRYDPTSKAQLALDINPDPRCLDEA